MFKVKYAGSIMMLVRLDLSLIVSLFQHKCEVSETVSTTTLPVTYMNCARLDYNPYHGIVLQMRTRTSLVYGCCSPCPGYHGATER